MLLTILQQKYIRNMLLTIIQQKYIREIKVHFSVFNMLKTDKCTLIYLVIKPHFNYNCTLVLKEIPLKMAT